MLVVRFAAWLGQLTLRQIIGFIPVVILAFAYYHSIPLPPELMLVGDLLAYIDIYSVLLPLGVLSRVATITFLGRQVAARAASLVTRVLAHMHRRDVRHRRARGAVMRPRREPTPSDDDRAAGVAWGQIAIA